MMKGSLAELEAVVAVSNRGGFRAAARELGVSSSALSQSIGALEARIGVRLFNRTTRSVSLSAAGEQFMAEIAPALSAIQNAYDIADEHRAVPTGTLRLNMARGAAKRILTPLVFEYLRRYSQMSVEIVTEDALIDVNAQGFDAGVRLLEGVSPDMIAVPITGDFQPVIVGSPDYFQKYPRPETPGDLHAHACIRYRMASGTIYRWELAKGGQDFALDVPGSLVLDDNDLVLEAVRAGMGLAYLVEGQVAVDLAAGRLERVLADWSVPYPGLCLYYPGRRHVPAKLRAFIALIRERGLI